MLPIHRFTYGLPFSSGWFIKYITLKFGGPLMYRRIRPVAFGLIFGEYVMVGIWMVVGFFSGIGYHALPR